MRITQMHAAFSQTGFPTPDQYPLLCHSQGQEATSKAQSPLTDPPGETASPYQETHFWDHPQNFLNMKMQKVKSA